jgi:hypothetical protein
VESKIWGYRRTSRNDAAHEHGTKEIVADAEDADKFVGRFMVDHAG